MTSFDLARSYMRAVRRRIKSLDLLFAEGGNADVVRESQECYELLTKAILRFLGIDPPKIHDVAPLLRGLLGQLPATIESDIDRICRTSKDLRKDRELSFYGELDFIPDESYSTEQAQRYIDEVKYLHKVVIEAFHVDLK